MSYGNIDKCEPNFTPLLDLVLQLVMFFMLCANFVMDQTNVQIRLPEAHAGKALDAKVEHTIYLNVNEKGQVVLPPLEAGASGEPQNQKEPVILTNAIQVESHLKLLAKILMKGSIKEKPDATIILRIDKQAAFKDTYPIMKACRNAGYSQVQLRVMRATTAAAE